jgi:hypothetical protein
MKFTGSMLRRLCQWKEHKKEEEIVRENKREQERERDQEGESKMRAPISKRSSKKQLNSLANPKPLTTRPGTSLVLFSFSFNVLYPAMNDRVSVRNGVKVRDRQGLRLVFRVGWHSG